MDELLRSPWGGTDPDPEATEHVDPFLARRVETRPWELRSAQWRAWELAESGIASRCQVPITARYRNQELGVGFRADMIVAECLLLELKCVECFNDIHIAQMITYLRLLGYKRGYLLNFNTRLLKHGIKRVSI